MANIVERTLEDGKALAFSVPLRAKHLLISSNSSVGFVLTLYETDGQGKRFHFGPAHGILDIKDYCGDSTQFYITANAGTPAGVEFVSVWVQTDY